MGVIEEEGRSAKFSIGGRIDCPSTVMSNELHSVADPQNRNAKFKDFGVEFRGLGLSNTSRATRENYALGVMTQDVLKRGLGWENNRKNVKFSNPSCDELRVL